MASRRETLSIAVIAHNEGSIADRTMRSLFEAVREIACLEIGCEFLVNVDRGDKKTIDYFKKLSEEKTIRLNYTNYGDPGLARNDILKKARGKYVAMIDADDVVSSNWLHEAMKMIMESSEKRLIHPEIEIRYNTECVESVSWRIDLNNNWMDSLALILGNRWCSVVLGRRDCFLKYPYSASNNGFGYEDYYFNCITVDAGIRHLVAKKTSVFCLQKAVSITKETHARNYVLPYVKLFDFKKLQKQYKNNGNVDLEIERTFVKAPDFSLRQAKKFESRYYDLIKMDEGIKEKMIDKMGVFEDMKIGTLFIKMINDFNAGKVFKTVAFVHNLAEYTESLNKGADAFIMVDECDNIVMNGNVLNFYKYFNQYPNWVKQELIMKILVQLKIKRIIVFGDSFGTEWCEGYMDFLYANNICFEKV